MREPSTDNDRLSAPRPSALAADDLRGVIVPLITPFTDDGELDERSFVELVAWLLDEGVHGFVLNGTTGESPTVRWPEVERLLGRLTAVVRGRVPVLVGTGTYDTAESVERTERALALGAHAAFAVVPYYSRPAPTGVIEHYRRIAAVGLPVVAYNIPYRTGLALDLPTLRAILAIPGIVGLKESTGGLANTAALGTGAPAILCGEDALFLPALTVGARGGILAAANLLPRAFVDVYRAWQAGHAQAARALFAALRPVIEGLFAEPNPAPLKQALARGGRIASARLRLPMVPIGEPAAASLAAALAQVPQARDLDDLAARFEQAAIPAAAWTHTAHVLVGAWHVEHFGAGALARMRAGIHRLNEAHGTPNTATRGYHETITRAYLELIAGFFARFPPGISFASRASALLAGPLAHKDALFAFYARERLMSAAARAGWVEPDRMPLEHASF
jgi:4-hydroxy-tetrahydrodipicolinate synthase